VYLARQRDLWRHVALKELAPYHQTDESFAERFVGESRLTGSMNHANIVTVHEYFESDGVPFIAMEYLPEGSLRRYVGKLSVAEVVGVLEGVLAGLSHGESHRVVHRDLKPENLLITGDGRVKIADFGIAKALRETAGGAVRTATGMIIGTPAYMAPEQVSVEQVDARTDLYSLGIVAYELVTGRVPFSDRENPIAVLYQHVHEPVPPVRSIVPEVDERLAAWIERLLAKKPDDRFSAADAAWEALEDVALDLIGPRWRREARLPVPEQRGKTGRPLTPAAFDAHAETVKPGAAEAAVAAPESQAPPPAPPEPAGPAREPAPEPPEPARGATTVREPEPARRPAAPRASAAQWRRRAAVLLVVLLVAGGAVAGVLAGGSGNGAKPPHTSTTTTASDNLQIRAAIAALGSARTRDLHLKDQATAATALAKDYTTAGTTLTGLQSSNAKTIHGTVTSAARTYTELAAAARSGNGTRYKQLNTQAQTLEATLRSEVSRI
jgi:hypothetical protein